MENNNGNNGNIGNSARGSVAVAFLIGAVAGGVAALLFAPQTGAQMRGRIKRGAIDIRDRGGDFARDMQGRAGNLKGAVSEARNTYRDEMDKQRMSPRSAVVETGEEV
jgi:gas vesicle protein